MAICLLSINVTGAPLNQATLNKINHYIAKSAENGVSGSVLLTQADKVIVGKGFGYADRQSKRKNTVETAFDIGSVTKQFTATAILKLVEQGKLTLSAPLSQFFSKLSTAKKSITLHQLLTHTAGFEDNSGPDAQYINKADFLTKVLNSSLVFEPGQDYQYSNVGYGVLAAIIEQVSGLSYEGYLSKYLFTPANMNNTGYQLPDWDTKKVAKGYRFSFADVGTNLTDYINKGVTWNLMGNGGMYASLTDLHRWHQALRGGRILNKPSLD